MADEQPTRPATPRERQFVKEYLRTWSAVKAAGACGYSRPSGSAHRVFNKPAVQAYLKERLAELSMSPDEVLARLAEQARAAYSEYLQPDGSVDLERMLADGKAHLIKGTKWNREGRLIVEFYDAQAALVQLGRAHGLFVDRQDTTVNLPVTLVEVERTVEGADEPADG